MSTGDYERPKFGPVWYGLWILVLALLAFLYLGKLF